MLYFGFSVLKNHIKEMLFDINTDDAFSYHSCTTLYLLGLLLTIVTIFLKIRLFVIQLSQSDKNESISQLLLLHMVVTLHIVSLVSIRYRSRCKIDDEISLVIHFYFIYSIKRSAIDMKYRDTSK